MNTTAAADSYTVTVHMRGEVFHLSHAQITFDSPNYFTACFRSGFSEAHSQTLRLDRHPAVFAIIVDYLSGYPVLPLSTRAISATMDMRTALRYLLVDAEFYDLQGLCDLLTLPKPTVDLSWAGFASNFVNLRDVLDDTLPEGIVKTADGSVVSADSQLPVFVHAQDMVMKIVLKNIVHGGLYPYPYAAPYFGVELSDPASPAASRTYTPSDANCASSEKCGDLRIDRLFDEGSITIDGHSHHLGSVRQHCNKDPKALPTLRPAVRGSVHVWNTPHPALGYVWQHRAWTFWADEVILAYCAAEHGAQSEQATTPTLISARLRTLSGILAELP